MVDDRVKFEKSLSQADAIPDTAQARVEELLTSGMLFRYGEQGQDGLDASLLERDFATYIGLPYACAVNSGGCALFLALKALDVKPEDAVLVSSFTLAPVAGAIAHAGARGVFVETTQDYVIDLQDLATKARASSAKVLLLSYMRGHIPDMDALMALCDDLGLAVVEDCAHTMGATWKGKHLGSFGAVGCYSTQTFKHINSGEGGLLATKDADIAAKTILYSGSYMLYQQHGARPDLAVFERWKAVTPNFSMRMAGLAAALLRPQLDLLEQRVQHWNDCYTWLTDILRHSPHIHLPRRYAEARYAPSSLQFSVRDLSYEQLDDFQKTCETRGVFLKWFGYREAKGFTATYKHWEYHQTKALPQTDAVLARLFDMRLPLLLEPADCELIGQIILESLEENTIS